MIVISTFTEAEYLIRNLSGISLIQRESEMCLVSFLRNQKMYFIGYNPHLISAQISTIIFSSSCVNTRPVGFCGFTSREISKACTP